MTPLVHVQLWGQPVGSILETDGIASFEYAPEFHGTGLQIAPVIMPLGTRGPRSWPSLAKETFHGLPSFLADALPDQFGMRVWAHHLRTHARELEDTGPIEKLALIGPRAMGALEFIPDLLHSDKLNASDRTPLQDLWQMAQALLSQKQALTGSLAQDTPHLLRFCGSPGGARAKALIAVNDHGEIKSGQIPAGPGFTQWILKFDGLDASGGHLAHKLGESCVEYAYHLMAQDAGIEMMPCRLHAHFDAAAQVMRHHFMTRRFDREGDEKIHVQTLCGLAGMDYASERNAYEDVVGVLRTPALGFHQEHQERLFRRMAFNVVAQVTDDHTKNMGFRMRPSGAWDLAPAYDLGPGAATASHRLSVNGKKKDIAPDDLLAVAKEAGIKAAQAKAILREVVKTCSCWADYAKAAQVSPELTARTWRQICSAGFMAE